MDVVFLIGRVLMALVFLNSGRNHFTQREGMVAYSRSVGAPAPQLMVPLTGLMILAGGLSLVLGVWADVGALLLVAFLLPTAYFMHAYWKLDDPAQRAGQQAHFLKNVALAGAALVVFYLYNQLQGDAGLSLTDPLFNRW